MEYKRIKIEFTEAKDRFFRTILVQEDTNLVILGCIFCQVLGSAFEHNFVFKKGKVQYSPDVFLLDGPDDLFEEYPMKEHNLNELGKGFKFLYDTGAYWLFDCKVEGSESIESNKLAYLIDGKGQGIWEDNKQSLMEYLEGKVDANSDEEDETRGLYLPWNFDDEKYGDFDNFDLQEAQDEFEINLEYNTNNYLDDCHDVGLELEVKKIHEYGKQKAIIYNMFGEKEDVEELVINKTKTDVLSSLKNINKEYAKKYMEEYVLDNYKEWKDDVIEMFKINFEQTKNDKRTIDFFNRLVLNENTENIVAPSDDVKSNIVFLYRENDQLKYYIPDEIKKIIWDELSKYKKHLN